METNMLKKEYTLPISGHGVLKLNAIDFYAQCKEYYKLLGQEISILPKKSTVTEVTFKFETYKWLPFQKYINLWVFSQDDDGGRSGVSFDLPLGIATGTKTPKECAIIELESGIADDEGELESLQEDMAQTKRNIQKKQKLLSKIQNS